MKKLQPRLPLLRWAGLLSSLALVIIMPMFITVAIATLLSIGLFYPMIKEKKLIQQAVLPPRENTSLADIKRLKQNPKYADWAMIRLAQMPEYKNLNHRDLKKILDEL